MIDNEITIAIEDGQVECYSAEPINFEDFLTATMTAILGYMNTIVVNAPEENQEEAKGVLYDALNQVASRTLELFAPEYELRPNLTAQAILEAENRIILEGRLGQCEAFT